MRSFLLLFLLTSLASASPPSIRCSEVRSITPAGELSIVATATGVYLSATADMRLDGDHLAFTGPLFAQLDKEDGVPRLMDRWISADGKTEKFVITPCRDPETGKLLGPEACAELHARYVKAAQKADRASP